MSSRAAIILAGGGSLRFQVPGETTRDKALELFRGRTLLEHVVSKALSFVDEVVVTVNGLERKSSYERLLKNKIGGDIQVRMDEDGCYGPLNGIRTGSRHIDSQSCIVLPTDTPLIEPRVFLRMFPYLERSEWVVPIWPNGLLEVLMSTFRRGYAFSSADLLCSLERSGPYDLIRGAPRAMFVSVVEELRRSDPNLLTFVNINYPRDLQNPPVKVVPEGPVQKSITLTLSKTTTRDIEEMSMMSNVITKEYLPESVEMEEIYECLTRKASHFWIGVIKEAIGNSVLNLFGDVKMFKEAMEEAAHYFTEEAAMFDEKGISFLSAHAFMDACRCLSKAGESSEANSLRRRAEDIYNEVGLDIQRKWVEDRFD